MGLRPLTGYFLKSSAIPVERGALAGKFLPATDDHVAILGVQFQQTGMAAVLFTGENGGPAAAKRIQNNVGAFGVV